MTDINLVNYRVKIVALWTVFLLGTLFHTQLALVPLFHGIDVAFMTPIENSATMAEIQPIIWGMLLFFAIPMLAIVAVVFNAPKRFRAWHFGLTIIYSILNFAHLLADLFVDPAIWHQIILMLLLFAIGILLNVVSYQWLTCRFTQHKSQAMGENNYLL